MGAAGSGEIMVRGGRLCGRWQQLEGRVWGNRMVEEESGWASVGAGALVGGGVWFT